MNPPLDEVWSEVIRNSKCAALGVAGEIVHKYLHAVYSGERPDSKDTLAAVLKAYTPAQIRAALDEVRMTPADLEQIRREQLEQEARRVEAERERREREESEAKEMAAREKAEREQAERARIAAASVAYPIICPNDMLRSGRTFRYVPSAERPMIGADAKRAIEGASATTKLARSVNSSVAGLTALEFQIKSLGGSQEDAAAGLGKLNEVLGDLSPEGEQARGMINRLGLQFDQLAKLPTDAAFARIAEKIGAIEDPARRAAAATAVFGDTAAALLPALSQGKAGLTAAQTAAEKLGLSFSDLDASKVEDANIKFGQLSDLVKGVSTQFAVNLAPWAIKVGDELSKLGVTGTSVGRVMTEAFRFAAKSIAFVVEYTKKAGILIVVAIQGSFTRLIEAVSLGLSKLFGLASKLADRLGGNMFKGLAEDAARFADASESAIKQLRKEALEQFNASNFTEQVDAFFDRVTQGAEQGAKALERLNEKTAKGALGIAARFKSLFGGQAKAVISEVQQPLERYQNKLNQLNAMVKSGALTWNQYAIASAKAVDELERAHGLGEVKLAGGLHRESTEALSTINQQDALVNQRFRQTPQQRVEALVKQSVEIERGILEAAKRIAAAVQQQPQLVPMP